MTPRMRLGLMVGAFGVLAAVAVAGWVRKPSPAAEPYTYGQAPAPAVAGTVQPTSGYDQYGQPVGSAQSGTYQANQSYASYAGNQTYPGNNYPGNQQYVSGDTAEYPSTLPAYADRRYVRTVRSSTEYAEPEYRGGEYQGPEYQSDVRSSNSYYYGRRRLHHGRSTGKSVAIVAGSAGVGAAIGGIAGGGKGAGIGALAGGAGGFIYDRLTHNH